MSLLVYSPGIKVLISTRNQGLIDVTDDLVSGSVNRIIGGVSSFNCRLANPRRKYDGVFTPNDRIVVQMKRIRWLQVFAGYLNRVPYLTAYAQSVDLTASCTLKRVQFHLWDPYAPESVNLMQGLADPDAMDGGVKVRAQTLLTEVMGWPKSAIHIGEVPSDWMERIEGAYEEVQEGWKQRSATFETLGGSASILGHHNISAGSTSANPARMANGQPNPATGALPTTRGRISWFGKEATGPMQLTGEYTHSANGRVGPDHWWCAMRFPYMESLPTRNPANRWRQDLSQEVRNQAVSWWRNRRVLVTHARTGKAVVLRCADWGPAEWTGKDIDVSKPALDAIGGTTNDEVYISFAPENARPGPFVPNLGVEGTDFAMARRIEQQHANRIPVPQPVAAGTNIRSSHFAWGGYSNGRIPLDAMEQFTDASTSEEAGRYLHPFAARAWKLMVAAAERAGFSASALRGSGFRSLQRQYAVAGPRAATPGTSNHGWGFAVDISRLFAPAGAATTAKYADSLYAWLFSNAPRFGWINPAWAQKGGSLPEPWHWEFWGVFDQAHTLSTGRISTPTFMGEGGVPSSGGGDGLDPGGGGPAMFNLAYWETVPDRESAILSGPLALMNDEPVMDMLRQMMGAAGRSFSSAPNGDFIAWFPDYFDIYGLAGKMVLRDIEVQDFSLYWDDERLKTHQYVIGAIHDIAPGGSFSGPIQAYSKYLTHGIASIEFPELLHALFNIDERSAFGEARDMLARFGPRVSMSQMGSINNGPAEFWWAVHLWMKNWAEQFSASVPITFMPEVYPGMIAQIPSAGFQAYVNSVTHNFNFTDGVGFSTTMNIIAPSTLDSDAGRGLVGMARGGALDGRAPRRVEEVGD